MLLLNNTQKLNHLTEKELRNKFDTLNHKRAGYINPLRASLLPSYRTQSTTLALNGLSQNTIKIINILSTLSLLD